MPESPPQLDMPTSGSGEQAPPSEDRAVVPVDANTAPMSVLVDANTAPMSVPSPSPPPPPGKVLRVPGGHGK